MIATAVLAASWLLAAPKAAYDSVIVEFIGGFPQADHPIILEVGGQETNLHQRDKARWVADLDNLVLADPSILEPAGDTCIRIRMTGEFVQAKPLSIIRKEDSRKLFLKASIKPVWYLTVRSRENYGIKCESKKLHEDDLTAEFRVDWERNITVNISLTPKDSSMILPLSPPRDSILKGRIRYDRQRIFEEFCQARRNRNDEEREAMGARSRGKGFHPIEWLMGLMDDRKAIVDNQASATMIKETAKKMIRVEEIEVSGAKSTTRREK